MLSPEWLPFGLRDLHMNQKEMLVRCWSTCNRRERAWTSLVVMGDEDAGEDVVQAVAIVAQVSIFFPPVLNVCAGCLGVGDAFHHLVFATGSVAVNSEHPVGPSLQRLFTALLMLPTAVNERIRATA